MARPESEKYELTEGEKPDLVKLINEGKPLPEKYRYIIAVKVIDIFGNDTMTLAPANVG
jgi:hypothetical protein